MDENGALYGVVGVDVTLANLTNYILTYEVDPPGKLLLVDRAGMILASQGQDLQGQGVEQYVPGLLALLTQEDTATPTIQVDGQRHYVFHQKASDQDWHLVVLVPEAEITTRILTTMLWAVLGLGAGLVVLSALTLLGIHRFAISPIKVLTRETDLIARTGDLNRRIRFASRDELGELASAYNEMISHLQGSQDSLRATEDALRRAHQHLVNVIEFLPDATFVLDETGQVIAWNRACELMTGIPKQDVMGRDDYAQTEPFYSGTRPALVDLLDRPLPEGRDGYESLERKGDVVMAEAFVPHLDEGRGAFLWGAAAPLYDQEGQRRGAIEVIRDVTPQKRIEQALRESESKYRELVEHANSIIMRWTSDGRIVFLNEFGQRFFGYSAEEIIGQPVIGTIVPEMDSQGRDLRPLMEQICANPVAFEQNVNQNMRRNGERVWIAWTNRIAQDEQGQVAEILSVGTDITELRRAEDDIRELNASLERRVAERTMELAEARDRAQDADRIKSAFLATMSHELRTPLNSIIGFTGILLQGLAGPLNQEQAKQLGMVQNSARHLLALINDVLDISKIEADQLEVSREPFDLQASIAKVAAIVKPLAEKKGLTLRVMPMPEMGPLWSDPRRVEQVLLNILNNAIKFTDQGSVTLTAEVIGATAHAPAHVRISVADSGIGIKAENLEKLFQPFRQIDSELSRLHEGTGLGLAICRRLIELLGGTVHVESVWGRGSTFSFTLPLEG